MSKSIIIPAKNEEGNLEELVKRIPSFKCQNEILIVCGKSKDKTLEKSHKLAKQFTEKNISVFEQKSKGKAGAVYEVLNNCNGELIAILDADDYSSKSRLELQTEILNENTDCDLIATSFGIHGVDEMIERPNQLINYKQHTKMLEAKDFIFSNPICHSSVMMRRELIFDAGLYDEKRKELFDFELWIRMLNGRKKVSILKLNLPLIFRNLHENQYFESKKRVNYLIQTYLLRRKLLSVLSHRFINELIIVCVLLYGLLPRFIRKRFMNKSKLGGT